MTSIDNKTNNSYDMNRYNKAERKNELKNNQINNMVDADALVTNIVDSINLDPTTRISVGDNLIASLKGNMDVQEDVQVQDLLGGLSAQTEQLKNILNIANDNSLPAKLQTNLLLSTHVEYKKELQANVDIMTQLLDKYADGSDVSNLLQQVGQNSSDSNYATSLDNLAMLRNLQNNLLTHMTPSTMSSNLLQMISSTNDVLDEVNEPLESYQDSTEDALSTVMGVAPKSIKALSTTSSTTQENNPISALAGSNNQNNSNYTSSSNFFPSGFGLSNSNSTLLSNMFNSTNRGNILICGVSVMMQLSYAVSSILSNIMDTVQAINTTVSYFKEFGSLVGSIASIDQSTIDKALAEYNDTFHTTETTATFNVLLHYYNSGKAGSAEVEQIKNFLQNLSSYVDVNTGQTYGQEFESQFGFTLFDFPYASTTADVSGALQAIGGYLNTAVSNANNYVNSMPYLCGNAGQAYATDMFGVVGSTTVNIPGSITLGNAQSFNTNNQTTVAGGTQNNNTIMNQEATLLSAIWQAVSMLLSNIKETYSNTAGRA